MRLTVEITNKMISFALFIQTTTNKHEKLHF